MIVFPKLGSEKTVRFFEDKDEQYFDAFEEANVRLTVRLLDRATVRAWGFRNDKILAEDKKRLKDSQGALGISSQAMGELIALQKDILSKTLVKVTNLQHGDSPLEHKELLDVIESLHDMDLLTAAAQAAMRAQTPTPEQVKG